MVRFPHDAGTHGTVDMFQAATAVVGMLASRASTIAGQSRPAAGTRRMCIFALPHKRKRTMHEGCCPISTYYSVSERKTFWVFVL
jgi:hypothetical protein